MLKSRHFAFIRYPQLIPVFIQVSEIRLAGQISLGIAKLFPKGKRNILSCSADRRGPGPADVSLPAHPLSVGIYSQFNIFVCATSCGYKETYKLESQESKLHICKAQFHLNLPFTLLQLQLVQQIEISRHNPRALARAVGSSGLWGPLAFHFICTLVSVMLPLELRMRAPQSVPRLYLDAGCVPPLTKVTFSPYLLAPSDCLLLLSSSERSHKNNTSIFQFPVEIFGDKIIRLIHTAKSLLFWELGSMKCWCR